MNVVRSIRSPRRLVGFLLTVPLLAGCTRAPSVDLLGSFFPAWLVCFVAGVALAALVRVLLVRVNMKVPFPVLVYPSLVAFFTFALWLVLFY